MKSQHRPRDGLGGGDISRGSQGASARPSGPSPNLSEPSPNLLRTFSEPSLNLSSAPRRRSARSPRSCPSACARPPPRARCSSRPPPAAGSAREGRLRLGLSLLLLLSGRRPPPRRARRRIRGLLTDASGTFPDLSAKLPLGGLVACAKTRSAARRLQALFSERRVRKSYVAVIAGTPPY